MDHLKMVLLHITMVHITLGTLRITSTRISSVLFTIVMVKVYIKENGKRTSLRIASYFAYSNTVKLFTMANLSIIQ